MGFILGLSVLTGCSEPREGDDWYSESVEVEKNRDAYIEHQTASGVSEQEARRNADLNWYIENTVRPKDKEGPPRDDLPQ